jgi:preprotein translocase subunit SecA
LATIAHNIGAVFSALNTHYPERKPQNLSLIDKAGLRVDQWLDSKRKNLSRAKFLADYRSAREAFTRSNVSVSSSEFKNHLIGVKRLLRHKNTSGFDDAILGQAFVLAAAAIKQSHDIEIRSTQVLAARAMLNGRLVEMATGEGKTYAAAIAASTAALAGIPVHLLTANEYLAVRDAQSLASVYEMLGLKCIAITNDMQRDARRIAYRHDIVYCTATEVIFDYLRDRTESIEISSQKNQLQQRLSHVSNKIESQAPVLRGLCFALIDEADSILIDEASTPFILARANKKAEGNSEYTVALKIASTLNAKDDFAINQKKMVSISDIGKQKVQRICESLDGLWPKNSRYREELVQLALTAIHCFRRDVDYIVKDDDVHIVDGNTGRIAEGRQWSRGLHQLIQAKEGVSQSDGQRTLIQLTYQRFFPRYLMLAGMSGTLRESASELRAIYGLPIEEVKPFKPSQRIDHRANLFFDQSALEAALVQEVTAAHARGQPILIGTDSVKASNKISRLLESKKFKHNLLNATEHKKESLIIAKAGELAAITVATNMAGRGTDIALSEAASSQGGLLVISCQANESKRIDRQLSGRSGRRGDPGCVKTLVSVKHGVLAKEVPSLLWGMTKLVSHRHGQVSPRLGEFILRKSQWLHEIRASRRRRAMMRSDEAIENRLSFGGRKD